MFGVGVEQVGQGLLVEAALFESGECFVYRGRGGVFGNYIFKSLSLAFSALSVGFGTGFQRSLFLCLGARLWPISNDGIGNPFQD